MSELTTPLTKVQMEKMSLEELRIQKRNVLNLEAVRGGEVAYMEADGNIYWFSCSEDACTPVRIQQGMLC